MTELQQYLAEEVAEDHADGIITRREAVRRLGLLGVGAAAASAMLTAEAAARTGGGGGKPPHGHAGGGHGGPHHGHADGTTTDWRPLATTDISFPGPTATLMAKWAAPAKVRGGVLVIHENRGLTPHIAEVAGRFAAAGFGALALDLLSEEGGTGAFPDEAAVAAALAQIEPTRFDNDMKAAVGELQRRVGRRTPLSAIGFCFGGGMVWRLLAAKEPRLSAAAPFYGPLPADASFKGNKAAVLAVYGGLDSRVNATRDAAKAALEAARLDHEILTFLDADHAFFNNTGARFNAPAAAEAWRRAVDWFAHAGKHDHR
jgi:carboxymethylenebutenolidase